MRTERLLVRFDAETRQLLQQLAERQGTSLSDAVRFAVREVAWRRGLSAHAGDLFTDRARRAFQHASDEATERRHSSIDGRHLVIGLLSVLDGRAALTLASLGVDLEAAYGAVDGLIGRSRERPLGAGGLTEAGKQIVEASVAEANRLEHHYVGTEHLLLGLLRVDDPLVRPALASLGVSIASIRSTIELQRERLARTIP
jgi:ATP-dependent Clp protease ATP-binding subunit ClpA